MLELIFVRHGETDNKKDAYCGWNDSGLNDNGIKQAYQAAQRLNCAKANVCKIFSSPLKRAAETAEIINKVFNTEIAYAGELKERNFGVWEGLTYKEIQAGFPEEYKLWANDWINYPIRGGESAYQVSNRVTTFITGLLKNHSNGVYIIVTHQGCIMNMLAYLLGMAADAMWRFKIGNGGIARVEIDDEKYAYLTGLNV